MSFATKYTQAPDVINISRNKNKYPTPNKTQGTHRYILDVESEFSLKTHR